MFASSGDAPPEFDSVIAKFWAPDVEDVLDAKIRDKDEYEEKLRQLFDEAANPASDQIQIVNHLSKMGAQICWKN
jgi:hypothetical protein